MIGPFVHLGRLAKAAYVLGREGAFDLVDPRELPAGPALTIRALRKLKRRVSEPGGLAKAFERLGPSWIKLGQFLATRRDVVGEDVARDLSALQDRLPPFPDEVARRQIEAAFDRPVEELYEWFGPSVAAASIAQVHKARTGGRDVAVKILRPGVEARFARDLRTFYFAARLIERLDPMTQRLRPVDVVHTLARSVTIEMDLRMEAAAISEMAENTADDEDFRVPAVDWTRSGKRILTIEWIEGAHIADREVLERQGQDLKRLGRVVIQSFLKHALHHGFFHADMHPGNLFVDPTGRLVAVDFGITGRLGKRERRILAQILWGFIRRDYYATAKAHFEAGYVPAHHRIEDFAQALRAIGEPVRDKRANEISMARLLQQLMEVTELFDMKTRPELILLQKSMVIVEGVARDLDPELDMWTAAEPVVGDYIRDTLGPRRKIEEAYGGLLGLIELAERLPEAIRRVDEFIEGLDDTVENGVKLHPKSATEFGKEIARYARSGRIALWILVIVAAGITVGASLF